VRYKSAQAEHYKNKATRIEEDGNPLISRKWLGIHQRLL
jgi:hypothetical protein